VDEDHGYEALLADGFDPELVRRVISLGLIRLSTNAANIHLAPRFQAVPLEKIADCR
jgi:hypothetical protein